MIKIQLPDKFTADTLTGYKLTCAKLNKNSDNAYEYSICREYDKKEFIETHGRLLSILNMDTVVDLSPDTDFKVPSFHGKSGRQHTPASLYRSYKCAKLNINTWIPPTPEEAYQIADDWHKDKEKIRYLESLLLQRQ